MDKEPIFPGVFGSVQRYLWTVNILVHGLLEYIAHLDPRVEGGKGQKNLPLGSSKDHCGRRQQKTTIFPFCDHSVPLLSYARLGRGHLSSYFTY